MAEAMKTLMEEGIDGHDGSLIKLEKAEDTLYLMYKAVDSIIAENVWEDDEDIKCFS